MKNYGKKFKIGDIVILTENPFPYREGATIFTIIAKRELYVGEDEKMLSVQYRVRDILGRTIWMPEEDIQVGGKLLGVLYA